MSNVVVVRVVPQIVVLAGVVHLVQTNSSFQHHYLKKNLRNAKVFSERKSPWVDRERDKKNLLKSMGDWEKLKKEGLMLVANARSFGQSSMMKEMLAERSETKPSSLFGRDEGTLPFGPCLFVNLTHAQNSNDVSVKLEEMLLPLFFKPWFYSEVRRPRDLLMQFEKAAVELASEGTPVVVAVDGFSSLVTEKLNDSIINIHMMSNSCIVVGISASASASADLCFGELFLFNLCEMIGRTRLL
jgi:hypothetical protein